MLCDSDLCRVLGMVNRNRSGFATDHLVTTAFLGLVECLISHFNKLFKTLLYPTAFCHTDADRKPVSAGQHGQGNLTDGHPDPVGHFTGMLQARVRQHHKEFFTTKTRQDIFGAEAGLNFSGDGNQNRIADSVTEPVINLFK